MRARRRQHAAHSVHEGELGARDLTGAGFAALLAHGLDDGKDAVHPGVGVGETASVGVDGQRAPRRRAAIFEEVHTLAGLRDAQ